MNENITYIPGRIKNSAKGGHICGPEDIDFGKDVIYLLNGKELKYQIKKDNTRYIINYDFDLKNKSINIPKNCVLEIQGGTISNGTIVGNNTTIIFSKPFLNKAYVIDCVSDKNYIKDTDVFINLYYNSDEIKTITTLVKDNGYCEFTGSLYKDIADIVISKSVSINFNGAEINPVHRSTGDNSQVFKSIEKVDKFELKNVKIDGGYVVPIDNKGYGTGTRNAAILIKNASNVTFDNVEITNYACGLYGKDWSGIPGKYWDDQSVLVVINYKNLSVTNCKLSTSSEEGWHFTPVIGDNMAVIANCEWRDFGHSLNLYDGKVLFENNKFINGNFSFVNLFCYDSIIRGNYFENGGFGDTALDLTEKVVNSGYYASNVEIYNNTFLECDTNIAIIGCDIDIHDNIIKSTISHRDCIRLLYPFADNQLDNYTNVNSKSKIKNGNINIKIYNNDLLAASPLNILSAERIYIVGNKLTKNGLTGVPNDKYYCAVKAESITGDFIFNNNVVTGEGIGQADKNELCALNVWIHSTDFIQIKENTFNITESANRAVHLKMSALSPSFICNVDFSDNKCNRNSNVIINEASGYIETLKFDRNINLIFHSSSLYQYLNYGNNIKHIASVFDLYGTIYMDENKTIVFENGGAIINGSLHGNNTTLKGDLSNNYGLNYIGGFIIPDEFGQNAPNHPFIGKSFYLNVGGKYKPCWYDGEHWVSADGSIADTNNIGTFTNRPNPWRINPGFRYLCTDRKVDMNPESPTYLQIITEEDSGMEIIFKGADETDPNNPIGIWIDAFGRTVS